MVKTINYKELEFFKKAHEFTIEIYKITKEFPKSEQGFNGLVSQLRRASTSVGSNIAEGSGRKGIKEFSNFLSMSIGSGKEAEYQLL